MVTDAPTLMMLRSRHRWRLQDFRPAAVREVDRDSREELEAGVDDSREIEQVEEALTRGPKVCHLCHLGKQNHRYYVTPFVKQLCPLDKDFKETDIKVANPFAMKTQRLHRRGVSVCACADFLRTDTVRGVFPLDEREPGSWALRRAATRTPVLPGLAQDHHGHEDPAGRVGRREDQMQDDPGELRHRHRREPRGGNEVCIKCIVVLSFQYCTKCLLLV